MEDITFSTSDMLLDGFDFQELIDTVYSNEPFRDEIRVRKVFNELLNARIKEAKVLLNERMPLIINELYK